MCIQQYITLQFWGLGMGSQEPMMDLAQKTTVVPFGFSQGSTKALFRLMPVSPSSDRSLSCILDPRCGSLTSSTCIGFAALLRQKSPSISIPSL